MWIRFKCSIDPASLGLREGVCAHCKQSEALSRHRILARVMNAIPVPSGEALHCPACQKFSRDEGYLGRAVGMVFLTPMVLLLLVGVGTGGYFAGTMLVGQTEFSGGFLFIAAILVSVASYAAYKVIRTMRRLLSRRTLLPMDNSGLTSI